MNTKKAGIVALVGRPNVGKSTLLNNLLNQKVSITSPKPQTTRFNIEAVYEDDRGQILFVDTPGIFGKVEDELAKKINYRSEELLHQQIDIVLYIIDHTRKKDFEENKALGLVRSANAYKILVINKIDVVKPSYMIQYKFMEEEFDEVIKTSALKRLHLNTLISAIYTHLPVREPIVDTTTTDQPALNMDSKLFLAELIREKAFLCLRQELPYTITTIVDIVEERKNGTLYIQGRIITRDKKFKGMIIGANGEMIKNISMMTRKEIEAATNKTVFLELLVEVDPHWIESM